MCKFILENGEICKRAPKRRLCSAHQIETTDPVKIKELVQAIREAKKKEEVLCPCGSYFQKWNFTKHIDNKKHIDWCARMTDGWRHFTCWD
jgi:hypothetical protein